jgi:L-alanine-DL-glutamate epimerase-like enolase superfamily enzyme
VELAARTVSLELAEPFTISRGTSEVVEVVEVELRHDGVSGFGEAVPINRYDQTAESAIAFVEDAAELLPDDPMDFRDAIERIAKRPGDNAAKSGIDAALHDLWGKLRREPVWRALGLERKGPPTSWTIWLGSPDDMARRAERVGSTFKRLKLKLGGRDGHDVHRVQAVRRVAEVPLQVDVNEAWTLDEALEALPQLAELGVEYCEQPLEAGDPNGVELKRRSPIPIFVDEDCHTRDDIEACEKRAHGLTIKLAKSGGIQEALAMVELARERGLGLMLGCMNESGLAVAAGAQIASLFDHVDLDGNLLLRHDPWPGVLLVDGVQVPSSEPGLGVRQAVPDPR